MTLEELIGRKKDEGLNTIEFEEYINTVGLNNTDEKDLELIIETYGIGVFNTTLFPEVYKMVSTKNNDRQTSNTNEIMRFWIILIGIMTTVMAFMMILIYWKPS
jgi:hypothetical protein